VVQVQVAKIPQVMVESREEDQGTQVQSKRRKDHVDQENDQEKAIFNNNLQKNHLPLEGKFQILVSPQNPKIFNVWQT
jgi:hypothetical protein